ncbi:MAG: right-handed parallel beta-helix repeat-containing protein [bacterium]|nr:right-handed parallel beta-helix repeat-containing protein [bacterium]
MEIKLLCVINSNVTIDGITIKEFQKRCMVVYNSQLTLKNSIVEGCDEGGVSLLGNSSALIVNNMFQFMNFGGIMLWQNSVAKVVNNTLNTSSIMFFFHPGTDDQAKVEAINNIFSGGSKITQVDWWKDQASKLLTNVKLSNNLFEDPSKCSLPLDYCADFPGKLNGDPLYEVPVGDMCGVANWGNYSLKAESPAVGIGDTTIPGTKNLGHTGGPCVDPNSSTCTSFIQSNLPPIPQSNIVDKNTNVQITDIPNNPQITNEPNIVLPTSSQIYLPMEDTSPTLTSIQNHVFDTNQANSKTIINIENKNNQMFLIKGIVVGALNQIINVQVPSGQTQSFEIQGCNGGLQNDGILYSTPDDNANTYRYKNIKINCGVKQTMVIE